MEKVCPRCKLPQKGINKCEYCGLIFSEREETGLNKKAKWKNSLSRKSNRKNAILFVIAIIGFFGFLYFYGQKEVAKKRAEYEKIRKQKIVEQKKEEKRRQQKNRIKQKKAALKTKSPEEVREDKIKRQFSVWDGSHSKLERLVKKAMNDPDSYDHVETVYWDRGDHLIVKTTFRGKNAFGGIVKNWVQAKVDIEGNVIQVLAQGP